MKQSSRKKKGNWSATTYHAVSSDDDERERLRKKPVTFHTIVGVSTTGISSSKTTALTSNDVPSHSPLPTHQFDDHLHNNDGSPDILEDFNFPDPKFLAWNEAHGLSPDGVPVEKRNRTLEDNPLYQWLVYDRSNFLEELLRLDGRGMFVHQTACACRANQPVFRCIDCLGDELQCQSCIVSKHSRLPLHSIEEWKGSFFTRISLKSLGLRIQLGHAPQERCINPKRASNNDFVIVDVNGIHEVAIDFCGCEHGCLKSAAIQLLRSRFYPATGKNPKSAATFRVLKLFHLLSFESKCSGYEFYSALSRLTDNTGTMQSRDRYDEFMRMVREWRHLKMLKRAGRVHSSDSIEATKPGELALLCPACPQPDHNLPVGWERTEPNKSWLYALFLAIDANFRLKRKKVSSEERDPSLGGGWSFFVEEKGYKEHLGKYWNQKQPKSTCVSHDAVDKPDREARGLAASGAGTVDCARHNLKRPNGVGDLQKGERYLNMDYLYFSSLRDTKIKQLVVSYDIACQWHLNLFNRMEIMPESLRLSSTIESVTYLIPKFHLPAHIKKCNLMFSFNLTRGVGRTDGEAPERGWSDINPVAQSTKEMGPGSRHDTLDDHFNDWNWKKIINFGFTMLKKIQEAVPARNEHIIALQDLESGLPPEKVSAWTTALELWESDSSHPNPFEATTKTTSEHAVRLQLSNEAAEEEKISGAREADCVASQSDIHPSIMISMGLQLEEEQRRLSSDLLSLGQHATANQLATIAERSNRLRRKIATWRDIQVLYIPEAAIELAKLEQAQVDGISGLKAQAIPLFLPSHLSRVGHIAESLLVYEWKLREGQAYDALHDIRHNLRLRSHLFKHKDRFARGVRHNTRSNATIAKVQMKINLAASKYRVVWKALTFLGTKLKQIPDEKWQLSLRFLADEDIRGLSEGLMGDSEGRRTVSWIWTLHGIVNEEEGADEALRIEWCRSRARALRWEEEVELLQEEMRRILVFLMWQAEWWEKQCRIKVCTDTGIADGVSAYAMRQATLRQSLHERFQFAWRNVAELVNISSVESAIMP